MAKKNVNLIWCGNCQMWLRVSRSTGVGICPRCTLPLPVFKCCRCGHEWAPRRTDANGYPVFPATCPSCKSPYAFRERVHVKKEGSA